MQIDRLIKKLTEARDQIVQLYGSAENTEATVLECHGTDRLCIFDVVKLPYDRGYGRSKWHGEIQLKEKNPN